MAPAPFFSVVIPTYNRADLLPNSLGSVFAQTDQDLEVIVVDNSSSDGTLDLLASYQDPRLSAITVSNQGNIANSRNVGQKAARGRWVAFLDSDDAWAPQKLARVRQAITDNPDVVLVANNEWELKGGERLRVIKWGPTGKHHVLDRLLFRGNCVSTSAATVLRETGLKVGGFGEDREFITVEDYDFWIKLAYEGPFFFIEDPLGDCLVHDSNISSNALRHARAIAKVWTSHLDRWAQKHPQDKVKARRMTSQVWLRLGRYLMRNQELSPARRFGIRALRGAPLDREIYSFLADVWRARGA